MDTTDAPQIIEHVNKSVTFSPYDVKWVPCSARFVAVGINARATGALKVYELNHGELNVQLEVSKEREHIKSRLSSKKREAMIEKQKLLISFSFFKKEVFENSQLEELTNSCN